MPSSEYTADCEPDVNRVASASDLAYPVLPDARHVPYRFAGGAIFPHPWLVILLSTPGVVEAPAPVSGAGPELGGHAGILKVFCVFCSFVCWISGGSL